MALESATANLDDATFLDAGGSRLWLEVGKRVFERRHTWKHLAAILQAGRGHTAHSDQLLDMVHSGGLDEDVATHVARDEDSEDLVLDILERPGS